MATGPVSVSEAEGVVFIRGADIKLGPRVPVGGLKASLLAWYKMDETSGDRADSTGNYNLTAWSNPGSAAGVIGNCVECTFAGNTILTTAVGKAWDGKLSVSLWVKRDANPPAQQDFFWISESVVDATALLGFSVRAGGLLAVHHGTVIETAPSNIGSWYHVVWTFEGASNKYAYYVNNSLVASGTEAQTNSHSDNQIFLCHGASRFDGYLDLVGVWKRVLSAQERADLYNAGAGLDYPF